MNYQTFMFATVSIIAFIMLGYVVIQNEYRCSYCGKFKFFSKWHRKGMYLHPDNIVNVCETCKNRHRE